MSDDKKDTKRVTAPTGQGLIQDEYWNSLARSFNHDFIRSARESHKRSDRSQMT